MNRINTMPSHTCLVILWWTWNLFLLFLICNDFKYNYQQLKYKTEVVPDSLLFPSFQIWNEYLLSPQICLQLQHLLDTVLWIVPDINMTEDYLHPTSSLILIVCSVLQLGKIGSNAAHHHWNHFLGPFLRKKTWDDTLKMAEY